MHLSGEVLINSSGVLSSVLKRPQSYVKPGSSGEVICVDARSSDRGGVIRMPGGTLGDLLVRMIINVSPPTGGYSHGEICALWENHRTVLETIIGDTVKFNETFAELVAIGGEDGSDRTTFDQVRRGAEWLLQRPEMIEAEATRVRESLGHKYENLDPAMADPVGFVIDGRTDDLLVPSQDVLRPRGVAYYSSGSAHMSKVYDGKGPAVAAMRAVEVATGMLVHAKLNIPVLAIGGCPALPDVQRLL